MRGLIAIFFVALTAGCATKTGTDGPVNIGPDLYMIGGLGGTFDHSGSALKAKFFQQAQQFCASKEQTMIPVNSTHKDAGMEYSSAEVQFRCISSAAPKS